MRLFILFIGILIATPSFSQNDSIRSQYGRNPKNIIRWNITPMAVVGPRSLVLGYERVLKSNQSISMNIGYLELRQPVNRLGQSLEWFAENKRSGFDISLDYRFYFKNRNKYSAPDGLYWGPYTALYNLNFEGESVFNQDGVNNRIAMSNKFYMISAGVQLGYQFLIKDRFSIDLLLMGPSFSAYRFNLDIDSQFKLDPDSEYYDLLKDFLNGFVPGSGVILDGLDFSTSTGKVRYNGVGFRYGVQIGYAF